MKRILILLLSAILLCAAIPCSFADARTEQTADADHVLIYNPLPYRKNANELYTGTLPKDAPDPEPTGEAPFVSGRHRTGKDLSTKTDGDGTHAFWICTDLNTYAYDKRTFRLAAETEHCRIWTMENDFLSFSKEQTQRMAEQFESVIYPSNTKNFGPFRDLGGDGKLHIVTYAMNSLGVCGFFDAYDLYTQEEINVIDPEDSGSYNCLPIINVNARMAENEQTVLCTLAHEFQHLILRSAVLASPANAGKLGKETTVGLWLNEGFSMEAEELSYPNAVEEQGYLTSFGRSDKVRLGMSVMNFDATSNDVGAYGQSFLFAQYLAAQCGDTVFSAFLDLWRSETDETNLTEAHMLETLLSDEQKTALDALADFTDGVTDALGPVENIRLSKLLLAFRLSLLLQAEDGILSIGGQTAETPVYQGAGRKIEGGGAILFACGDGFTVPQDADSGLVFVFLREGAVTAVYTVPEPEEGFYAIAVQTEDGWLAIPASPSADGIMKGVAIGTPKDGAIPASEAYGAIFAVTREGDGFRFSCDDENGVYALTRTGTNAQTLAVQTCDTCFSWRRFADGADRLQADGLYGRGILYSTLSGGFGYYAPAYFDNNTFIRVRLLRVTFRNGDANLDGRLTAADAAAVLRTVVRLSYLNAPMRAAADCNGDGRVSAADASKILRIVVQLESEETEN